MFQRAATDGRDSAALFRQQADVESLLNAAESVCSPRAPIHGTTFYLAKGYAHFLRTLADERKRIRGFTFAGSNPCLIRLPYTRDHRESGGHVAQAQMWMSDDAGAASVIGLSDDFHYLWQELQKYCHSEIVPLYARTADFRRAIHAAAGGSPIRKVRVCGFTANVLCDDGRRVKTRREWFPQSKPETEFFAELEQERQWLRSIEVTLESAGIVHGRAKRDLTFSCQAGFAIFHGAVIRALRHEALAGRAMLQNRSVSDSPTHAPRPIQIAFDRGIFEDKGQNQRLIRVLRKLPDASLSVFHANPFLHASVVDYTDGSSYTLWITSNAAITVVPALKSSDRALGRLCNHINEHFAEGVIEEARA